MALCKCFWNAFHRKLNDNGPTVSRIFTKSTPPFFLVAEYLYPFSRWNTIASSKREEKEKGAKETEATSKIRGKWNTANHSFYKAIRVVCFETMLGINPIGIDLVIGSLPLYACSSELSVAYGDVLLQLQSYWLPITSVSGAYSRRSYLTRVAFESAKKANVQIANSTVSAVSL